MNRTMDRLHSLAWCQPFGTAMLHGKIETRKYNTKVRGPVLIYTTKKPYDLSTLYDICYGYQIDSLEDIQKQYATHNLNGYAIAVGNLVKSVPMQKQDSIWTFIKYHPSLWCWHFEDVKLIEPFKYEVKLPHSEKMVSAGGQGWGWVPEELMNKIIYL